MSFSVKLEPNDDDKSDIEPEPELIIDDLEVPAESAPMTAVKLETNDTTATATDGPILVRSAGPSAGRQDATTVSDLFSSFSGPRRCETCDIKFTYLKSYLAHKEFYCKERNNNGTTAVTKSSERMTSSSPSNGLSNAVTNSRAAEVL